MSVLDDATVRAFFRQAWLESQPGTDASHEEGGFILRNANGELTIERWPPGAQNQIRVPPHPGGQRGNLLIVATFHTHPSDANSSRSRALRTFAPCGAIRT